MSVPVLDFNRTHVFNGDRGRQLIAAAKEFSVSNPLQLIDQVLSIKLTDLYTLFVAAGFFKDTVAESKLANLPNDATKFLNGTGNWSVPPSSGLSDGDKGDITVSGSGTVWTIDNDAVSFAKMQNINTNALIGRATAGTGDPEEITCTAAGRALLDDADASAQRTTLGLGDLATLGSVGTGQVDADAITFVKMQNITTDRLIGRDTAASGDPEEIALAGSLVFTGSASIQLSGDAASPGNNKVYSTNASGTKGWNDVPDAAGWTTIVAAANQDVTNAQNQDHTTLQFAVTAGNLYAVELWLFYSTNDTTGDFEYRWAVSAGTMDGYGCDTGENAANAVGNTRVSAAAAANTANIAHGAQANLDIPVPARCDFTFRQNTSSGTFKLQFGNNTVAAGRTSRVLKGSILRYKQLN